MLFRYEPIVFDQMFSRTSPAEWALPEIFTQFNFVDRPNNYPSVNVVENKEGVLVVAEIPGVLKEDVKVQLQDGTLTISGERKQPEEKDSDVLRREIRYGSFSRTIELPESVETEKVTADCANGVLRISLPKREAAKPKEISIR